MTMKSYLPKIQRSCSITAKKSIRIFEHMAAGDLHLISVCVHSSLLSPGYGMSEVADVGSAVAMTKFRIRCI